MQRNWWFCYQVALGESLQSHTLPSRAFCQFKLLFGLDLCRWQPLMNKITLIILFKWMHIHECSLLCCAQLCNFDLFIGRTVLCVAGPDLVSLQWWWEVWRGRTGFTLFKNNLAETGRTDKDFLIGKTVKRTRGNACAVKYWKFV